MTEVIDIINVQIHKYICIGRIENAVPRLNVPQHYLVNTRLLCHSKFVAQCRFCVRHFRRALVKVFSLMRIKF